VQSHIESTDLLDFFLNEFKPSPILSPWNGRGGFRTRKPQKGERAIQAIIESNNPRLEPFRQAIQKAREIVDLAQELEWADETGKVTNKHKPLFLAECRAVFPDEALDWLDVAFVLSDDKKPRYPLIVGGSGGALGSGDISSNYLEAVGLIIDPKQANRSRKLLTNALFGEGRPLLSSIPIGHMLPGTARTVNSSAFGTATSAVNPWSFVLGMEGTLLFASGVARRFKGARGMATMPFTVPESPVGYSAAHNETVKGEMWLPVWARPMTLPEVRRILAEGRLSWGGKGASNGLDAAKAISSLGVDRGLSHFERYVVAARYGDMTLAMPAGCFPVVKRPRERVHLLHDVDPWLSRIRSTPLPASARSAMRQIDAAQMRVARTPEDPTPLQDLLAEITRIEWIVSRNPDLRTRARNPVPPLSTDRWAALLDDGTVEWSLAIAIATQRDHFIRGQRLTSSEQRRGSVSCLLRPVKLHADPHRSHQLEWADTPAGPGLSLGLSIEKTLADILVHRTLLCRDRQVAEDVTAIGSGSPVAFDWSCPAPIAHISAFLDGSLDLERLGRLIRVAALLNRPPPWSRLGAQNGRRLGRPAHPARALLGPFFHGRPLKKETEEASQAKQLLLPSLSWPQRLRAGQTYSVFGEALIRLRAAGFRPGVRPESLRVISKEKLLASLLIPSFPSDVWDSIGIICPPTPDPTNEEEE
jgi:CRISPR-associated protein Csx17